MTATDHRFVDLGFVSEPVPMGAHICQIYVDPSERDRALRCFTSRGLLANEATACFSDNLDCLELEAWFEREGLTLNGERSSGRFLQAGAEAVYFENGTFDPDRMLNRLKQFHRTSVASCCTGARAIGEMSPAISRIAGGSRLFEYEARVNQLRQDYPVTAVCQYDARAFDGAMIMDVLTVHPMMVIRGAVIKNPHYVPPEEFVRQ